MHDALYRRDCCGDAYVWASACTGGDGDSSTNVYADAATALRHVHTDAKHAQPTARWWVAWWWAAMNRTLLVLCVLCCASVATAQEDTATDTPTSTPTRTPTNTPTHTYTPSCWENIVKAATPLAFYRFDDPNDATIFHAAVGLNGNRSFAVAYNQTGLLTACDGNPAVDSLGTGYMTTGNWYDGIDDDITYGAIVASTYVSANVKYIMSYGDSSGVNWLLGITSGAARCYIKRRGDNEPFNVYDVDTTATDGNFHFLACHYDGVNLSLYRDGSFVASTPMTGDKAIAEEFEHAWYRGSSDFLDATIDELFVFDRDLTEAELDWIYGSIGSCCATFTPTPSVTDTPSLTPTPTITHTPTPVATNSCCYCGEDENCVCPESYGVGWECPRTCTPIPQAACAEVP